MCDERAFADTGVCWQIIGAEYTPVAGKLDVHSEISVVVFAVSRSPLTSS